MKDRVVVAMSGGVDSSVAAALVKQQGFQVVGMTMCFSQADAIRKKPACCGTQGITDARRVCHALGIRHYVINMQRALEEKVIKEFCSEYLSGRTPNPCVRCNQFLKFDILLKKALALDARYLATGHYARITRSNRYNLRKARDARKDQSYFLYRLGQAQLKHILFPVGDYTKEEVRALAGKFKLPVADKTASQEICFLPQDNYRLFLKARAASLIKPGEVVDSSGAVVGAHRGIAYYTVGQREGLGIAAGYPLYITRIDARHNRLVVGRREDVVRSVFTVRQVHWTGAQIKKNVVLNVRIRYNHKEAVALIKPQGEVLTVHCKVPQFAITPGQSAVFYERDTVRGGGIIDEVYA